MDRVLTIWKERGVFDADTITKIRKAMSTNLRFSILIFSCLTNLQLNIGQSFRVIPIRYYLALVCSTGEAIAAGGDVPKKDSPPVAADTSTTTPTSGSDEQSATQTTKPRKPAEKREEKKEVKKRKKPELSLKDELEQEFLNGPGEAPEVGIHTCWFSCHYAPVISFLSDGLESEVPSAPSTSICTSYCQYFWGYRRFAQTTCTRYIIVSTRLLNVTNSV